jgi:hypothetical protein
MLAAVLSAVGVAPEQTALVVGFVLPFDRLLDMTAHRAQRQRQPHRHHHRSARGKANSMRQCIAGSAGMTKPQRDELSA